MTPLPAALLTGPRPRSFTVWRLDRAQHQSSWDQGIGAEKVGGRWNPEGQAVIYASLDPSTTILESAVHAGFASLDTVPHVLLEIEILKPSWVRVVQPEEVPNPRWLVSGSLSKGQQTYGSALLTEHPLVLMPSAVSTRSWNVLINPVTARGGFALRSAERFGLDPRLNR